MVSPNTKARGHRPGTHATRTSPRLHNNTPKNDAPTGTVIPITSWGSTAKAKGGGALQDGGRGTVVRSLSFATPATTTNSVSSLSHSTKTSTKMSGGKRDCDDRSSIANASEKRTKTNPMKEPRTRKTTFTMMTRIMTTFPLQIKPSAM